MGADDSTKFAVLGAGNAGHAMSAHLSRMGFEVNLFELPMYKNNIIPIKERGGIEIIGARTKRDDIGFRATGFAKLDKVTTDIEDALKGVDVIMVAVPAFAHRTFAKLCAPHLEDGQIVVLNPGRTFGAIEFANTLNEMGTKSDVIIAETHTLLYQCRVTGPAQVTVFGFKKAVECASFPGKNIEKVIQLLNKAYPQFRPVPNVLKTSLDNTGALTHPSITIFNAGSVERKEDFLLRLDGVTPAIARVIEALEQERLAVAKALEIKAWAFTDFYRESYGVNRGTIYDAMHNKGIDDISGPKTLHTRLLLEDIPCGLVPMASLGDLLGVPTPAMKAMIKLASLLLQVDFWREGRTVEKLGLAGLSANEIVKFVT